MPKLTIFTNEWSFYSGSLVNPRSITLSGSAFAVSSSLGMPYLKTVDLPMNAFSKKKTAHTYSAPLFSHSHIDIGALNKYFYCSLSFTNKPPHPPPQFHPTPNPIPPFLPQLSLSNPITHVFRNSETICTRWHSFCQTIQFLCFNLQLNAFPHRLRAGRGCCGSCLDCAIEEASQRSGARKRLPLHLVPFFPLHHHAIGVVVSLASSASVPRTMSRFLAS